VNVAKAAAEFSEQLLSLAVTASHDLENTCEIRIFYALYTLLARNATSVTTLHSRYVPVTLLLRSARTGRAASAERLTASRFRRYCR